MEIKAEHLGAIKMGKYRTEFEKPSWKIRQSIWESCIMGTEHLGAMIDWERKANYLGVLNHGNIR